MDARQWHYVANGNRVGPVSREILTGLFQTRHLESSTLVWTADFAEWVPASTVEGLVPQAAMSVVPPPLPVDGKLQVGVQRFAGFWMRFCAAVIDAIVLMFFGGIVGGIVGAVLGVLMSMQGYEVESIQQVGGVAGYFVGIVGNWLYFTSFESSASQATPGKMAMRLRVTDLEGWRISFARSNGRYWGKMISGIILLVGYFMVAFTEKRQALHDIMAGCVVVYK